MKRRLLTIVLTLALLVSMTVLPVSASAASTVKILRVTEDGARVRVGPSTLYNVLTSLKSGAKVFYLGKTTDSFAYIRTSKGVVGYMYKGFLKNYGAATKKQIYYSTKSKVGVYKKASSKSSKVAKLAKREHVFVYQVRGKWAYIRTLNGKGGYVKKSNLKKAS